MNTPKGDFTHADRANPKPGGPACACTHADRPQGRAGGSAPGSPWLQRQPERDLQADPADPPAVRDRGRRKNSQGKVECRRGCRLHLDVIGGDIPASAIQSSAGLHDSQVAIPLARMTAGRGVSLHDLADAAYDAKGIRAMSGRLGHVAVIDDNPGRGEKRKFSSAEAVRYRERSGVERINSHLHEEHGGRHVRVCGPVKVAVHLVFGPVVIAAEQMLTMSA